MSSQIYILTSDEHGVWYKPTDGTVDADKGVLDYSLTKTPTAFVKVWKPPANLGYKQHAMLHLEHVGAVAAWDYKVAAFGFHSIPAAGFAFADWMRLSSGVVMPVRDEEQNVTAATVAIEPFPNKFPYLGIAIMAETVVPGGLVNCRFTLFNDRDLIILDAPA